MTFQRITHRYFKIAGLALAAALGSMSAHADISPEERQVLVDLYNSAGGANWSNKNQWLGLAGTECAWNGVTCDSGKTHVTALKLNFNNLTGTLPASLGTLTELTSLNLRQNALTGAIPDLSGLTKLVSLDLGSNQLSGEIPPLTGLADLVEFRIQGGQLTGSTPALTALTHLQIFNVSGNKLNGQIGALAGATALQEFNVNTNQLTGPIPDMSGLTALKTFSASNNKLTSITSLAGLGNLDSFIASSNQLSGSIPSLLGLGKLRSFYVEYNQLSGPIPPLTDLVNIENFYVRDNQLTGQIPSLDGLTKLRALWIQNNQLVGSPPLPPNQTMAAVPCPNPLRNSTDAAINLAWDNIVTGSMPWANGCTGSWDVTPSVRDANSGEPITDGSTGTISPSTVQILPAGGSAQFTMTPAPGYRLRTPIGASCPGSRNGNVFTAGPVTANCSVPVVFVRDASSPDDGVCGSDDGKILSEAPTNLCSAGTASAVAGSGPWTWSCAGTGSGVTAQCSAQKAGPSWIVTAVTGDVHGTVNPGSQSVANGTRATVGATPDAGYMLSSASGCGGATVSGNTATTAPITENCTVTLNFAPAHETTTQFVSVEPPAPRVGDQVTVRVTVSADDDSVISSGTVTISGGGASCIANLDSTAHGQCNLRFTRAGEQQLTATYPGSPPEGFLPSSAVSTVTVTAVPGSLTPVPTLSEWSLALLAALMLLAGIGVRPWRG